jgi:general secretion pathway protein G
MKRQAGFTLIELMIVMAIITILAAIGLAVYGNSVQSAREATLRTNLHGLREAIDQYYADKNHYPPSLDSLVEDKYIREIPVDPITRSSDTWQTTLAEPEPGNPSAESGIYDVKSGAEGTGLDGTPYSEW